MLKNTKKVTFYNFLREATESTPGMARGREPDNESGDDADLRAR